MRRALFAIFTAALTLTGCDRQGQPPSASVTVAGKQISMVMNGYQWSNAYGTTIADAASDPARHLKKYPASPGAKATLSFDKAPKTMQLTMWSNGLQVSKSTVNGDSFNLPKQPGEYTYEVTGQWGNEYVNYDFEVKVH